jgi:4-aminobutyrate aminotransferase-like enzyme
LNKQEILDKQKKYLFSCVATYYDQPLVVDHAKDQYVYDADGKEFLDFFGGILTVSVGHCNERVTKAVDEQTHKLQHMSTLYANEPQVQLAEKLAQITPGRLEKSFFTNSGTEANETAVLLAQIHTKCQDVIALRHSYSGRSYLALSLSAQSSWRLTPNVVPGVHHIANAYCYRCPFGLTYPSCNIKCATDIEEAIQTMTSQGRIAAFLAEPIQGVGGFITPPKEYFKEIVAIVKKYGGLFICDEVQTGWGRTGGKMFGIEHWGVEPDIMTFAKGMANGVPIGATIATPDVADSMQGNTISTIGGKYPIIGDVRGMGLMQGMELVGEKKKPDAESTKRLMELTKNHGLLLGKGGTYGNVVRVSPALNVNKDQIDHALKVLDQSFSHLGL